MSIKIMSWVLDHSPYEGKARLVHLVLADHANDAGLCWPSQETIASRAGCSVEHVRMTVNKMVEDGYLVIVKASAGRGSSHNYRLEYPKSLGGSQETPKSTGRNPQVDGPKPPNPSPKNRQEPSKNQAPERCPSCKRRVDWSKGSHSCV